PAAGPREPLEVDPVERERASLRIGGLVLEHAGVDVERDFLAAEAARLRARVAQVEDRARDLATGVVHRLARLGGDEARELLAARLHAARRALQDVGAREA